MPQIFNKHHKKTPPTAVYIGRGSPYGNPFVIGTDGNRDEVCDKFDAKVRNHPNLPALVTQIRADLRGRDLECFCAPARCHGELLMEIANSEGEWPSGLPLPTSTPPMPAIQEAFPKESLPTLLKVIDDEIEYNQSALKTYADNKPTHALLTNKNFHLQILRKWLVKQGA